MKVFMWVGKTHAVMQKIYCKGHIMVGSFMGRGNQYIQLVKVLYCKLLTKRQAGDGPYK